MRAVGNIPSNAKPLGMDMTERGWERTTFSRNRERRLEHDVAAEFFYAVVEQARRAHLTSSEHFTVDGTLIGAWASLKSSAGTCKEPASHVPQECVPHA